MASVRFTHPPLYEIVFSVELVAPGFSSVHFGLYWESIRSEFPFQEDYTPLILEDHENSIPLRVCFISNDRQKIIQLQENLFLFNWSYNKQEENPDFGNLLNEFIGQLNHLQEWWLNISDKPIQIHNFGLAYLNKIDKGMGWENAKDYSKIFNLIQIKSSGFLSSPDSCDFQIDFLLPDESGILSVKIEQSSISDDEEKSDSEDLLFFQLIARIGETNISIKDWFEIAHDYIIKAFLEITTEDAQKLWGRYD